MHIWTIEKWEKNFDINGENHRTGLRLKFDKEVDPEVKRACKEFCKWLRKEYFFPMRIPVYIKSSKHIKALDGELVSATFFEPDSYQTEPYIRVAAGDYYDLIITHSKDNALAMILRSISHELTHYFQWINNLKLTPIGEERQAMKYAEYIVDEYAETREHP